MTSAYSIEIVPADRGWILEQIANHIYQQSLLYPELYNVKILDKPTGDADLTFFLPQSAYQPLDHSITVTYFAHKEDQPAAAKLFDRVAGMSDVCVTSSTKYKNILESVGARKVYKLHLGVDTELFTPLLRLGVVGRTYHTNRKGEWLLAEINNMPMVELCFTGEGWPTPANYYSSDELAKFYQQIDFLLIPSLIEGGPVPMLEALASGCEVIAPTDIGLVEDFPHIPYKLGDAADLKRVIEEQLAKKVALRNSVLECDWKHHAERTLEIFSRILGDQSLAPAEGRVGADSNSEKAKILLLTHGSEARAKGGPSTRIKFLEKILSEQGLTIRAMHDVQTVAELEEFDIIHVFNSWGPHSALETLKLARRAGKKIVFSPIALDLVHHPLFQQFLGHVFNKYDDANKIKVINALPLLTAENTSRDAIVEGIGGHFDALRRCCALADSVICLSRLERKFLGDVGIDVDKVEIVPNGIEENFGSGIDQDEFRKKYGLQKYVLCVGRIEYRKNQALLAYAMRDMDVSLVLLGGAPEPAYLEQVQSLGGENLVYIPRIEDRDLLASAYKGASVFVLPSWCEGAPMSALEAGICGAPLVLSDRSSEQEYFGDTAHYVSPANVGEIKKAIEIALSEDADENLRKARSKLVKENYSAMGHARNTLKVYEKLSKLEVSRELDDQEILLDVSAMLHYYRIDEHLTGIPLAERNIVAEIISSRPTTRCIVYNGAKNKFIEIPYEVFSNFDADSFNKRYWFSNDESVSSPGVEFDLNYHCTLVPQARIAVPRTPKPTRVKASPPPKKRSRLRTVLSLVYQTLFKVPQLRPLLSRCKNYLFLAVHYFRLGKNRLTQRRSPARLSKEIDFSDLSQYFEIRKIPRQDLKINPGSRIITLGQGWLSNEPLLQELIRLSAGNELEAYVYDISYVSGSHYSGWSDNEDRQRRLDNLLENCSAVYTESKITERELAKYGRSRSWNYKVVRTKLRGKDPVALNRSFSMPQKSNFVLYVASFNRRKNHDFIVNVWKDLQKSDNVVSRENIKLYLVGGIQGETKYGDNKFQNELEEFNIEVLGGIPEKLLNEYYQTCLFTVFPSMQEGWGIPIEESLLYGKVCLVSDQLPAAQEIYNPALIKLDPNDFFGWREAITTWASNPKMREEFGKKAQEHMPVSWRAIAECVLNRESISDAY